MKPVTPSLLIEHGSLAMLSNYQKAQGKLQRLEITNGLEEFFILKNVSKYPKFIDNKIPLKIVQNLLPKHQTFHFLN